MSSRFGFPFFRPARPLCRALALVAALVVSSAHAASPDVVISQVYGGGGNSGATYKNDFIELYNRGSIAVSLGGWSVQYASATGTTWQVTSLTAVTLQPGQYYLVQEALGAGGTVNLPTPDATGTIAMSGTAGKVALVTSTTALSCASACAGTAAVKDFVGFGTTANNYEGAGATPAPSNINAVLRAGNGATDTDSNAADFSAGPPNPRNTGVSGAVNGNCGSANGQSLLNAPIANLCSAGTPSAVTGTGPWAWSCAGTNGGTTASCSANLSTASPISIFHTNDVHARLTPHKWVINQHGSYVDTFEDVGGAAALAGKMLSLVGGKPTALVLDGGDISEGNPVGDMNSGNTTGFAYGNGGMTGFYELMHGKLKTIAGRGGRGMDALVVGNHDVRDASYITNMEHMAAAGVPVISSNIRDINCTAAHPRFSTGCEHFPAYTTVMVNGVKVGLVGFTTPTATVGASLASTLTVVDCPWTGGTTGCNMSNYVNTLRNVEGAQIVILLTHDGHSDLTDPTTPVIADTVAAQVPEIVVSGHWHTWTDTVWQPQQLNYKTLFVESSSYMKYIGEVTVSPTGSYLSAQQHVLRNADITPDPDVQAYVDGLIGTYNLGHPGFPVSEVVGYTNSNLLLDDRFKWWSADEYPWNGNNTAGQWITDAMQWKCSQIWAAQGGCDLAMEAGGGVRADIPAGPVTYMQVYETFPWADDLYVRISLTGQDIKNFLKATNMDAGFSSQLDVTAFDGIATSVKFNGQPINLTQTYTVAINDYMLAHPPSGYTWPVAAAAAALKATLADGGLVRDSLSEFMRTLHATPATAYDVGGDRIHLNGQFAGGYDAVITMMDDNESKPTFEKAFIRLLTATPETLARRGSKQVPTSLVNADGTINQANRLAEIEMYRSFLGFKKGTLKSGDIIRTYGKASFFGGTPEFVDQEGVYANGVEFNIVGHDDTKALPTSVPSIGAFWNDNYKNHFVKFLARKTGTDTVVDQYSQSIKIWDTTGYNTTALALPGNVGDVLEITGVPTMENYALRFRRASAVVSTSSLPVAPSVASTVDPLPATSSGAVTLSANLSGGVSYSLAPVADAQVASGGAVAGNNYGTGTNFYVQSSSTSSFGNERAWLRFDLGSLPAGLAIRSASLQLWNWKSAGASLPAAAYGGADDTWGEATLTYNNQPVFGTALDTVTLTSGTTDLYYGWNVGAFVGTKYAGNKLVSLMVKAVTEGSADATAPAYSFDSKEFGSNAPFLQVTAQGAVASVQLYFRYSSDNSTWGSWTAYGSPLTAAPYTANFGFPNGNGYYQFYSLATDTSGRTETAPSAAQASVQYTAVVAAPQTITFTQPASVLVNTAFNVSATSSSGLTVTFSSTTPAVCTVSGVAVSTLGVGTCTLVASQAGNASWQAAPTVTRDVAVTAAGQTISFSPIPGTALTAGTVGLTATASSGLAVTFSSQTSPVCTVSGSTVTLVSVGTCTVAADQPGDATFAAAATATQSFAVTAGTAGSGDVPLPPWALWVLGAGLTAPLLRRLRRVH
jgi:2',3'-cyclic-nucleotide 2'-phosphodiesterase (5'-nucleotidase family)